MPLACNIPLGKIGGTNPATGTELKPQAWHATASQDPGCICLSRFQKQLEGALLTLQLL
jgi:hypothetical protein